MDEPRLEVRRRTDVRTRLEDGLGIDVAKLGRRVWRRAERVRAASVGVHRRAQQPDQLEVQRGGDGGNVRLQTHDAALEQTRAPLDAT